MDRRIEADPKVIINEFIAAQDAESTLNNVLIQLQEYYAGSSVSHHGSEWIIYRFKAPISPSSTATNVVGLAV